MYWVQLLKQMMGVLKNENQNGLIYPPYPR